MPDAHRILGVDPAASPQEITAAYRQLAKRLHPDRAGLDPSAARRMAEINVAYETMLRSPAPAGPAPAPAPRARRSPGWWLEPALRQRLGRELLAALEEREPVFLRTPAATWSSPSSLLVLTDRRLLWLGEDAVLGRVRDLRLREAEHVAVRRAWPSRRSATLLVRTRNGRRHSFAGLSAGTAHRLAEAIRAAARMV